MAAGFTGFEITWRKAVFDDAPQSGSAASFGTLGINFRASKAVDEEESDATSSRRKEIPPTSKPASTTA